ncbi:DUF2927 domain-containing protein [Tabrizicola sp.]|uniref:DUF2927 domain-containing protein n=1 Tax=Tabrizicola sp. TaxID=2005166 RepID=UPI0035B0F587
MRLALAALTLAALAGCTPPAQVSKDVPLTGVGFGALSPRAGWTGGQAGHSPGRDFIDLSFALESGQELARFTRFEGPITLATAGEVPPTARRDLEQLVARLRDEAGIDIALTEGPARITVEFARRAALRPLAPQAACFVVPNVGSLAEYRRARGTAAVDWARITRRERAAVFIPLDTSPQEMRDCLHEELAQALGPLNDLYRLSDSVFNDDNFHSTLTDFDMEILRLTYSPALATGMTRQEVAARLGVAPGRTGSDTPLEWVRAIEAALGRNGPAGARQGAAERALAIATAAGWQDSRAAFSHFAVGRLTAGSDPLRALQAFDRAGAIWSRLPGGEVQLAHVDMQLAAMALAGGLPEEAVRLADRAMPVVRQSGNAALLATLMLVKAEALEALGNPAAAAALRLDSQPWARYGFGPDSVVKVRMRDIAAVAGRASGG